MYSKAVVLAAMPLYLVSQASVDLFSFEVPPACSTICGPVVQRSQNCIPSLLGAIGTGVPDKRSEERDCVCSNLDSVANTAALCADCLHQHSNDIAESKDGVKSIDKIMSSCSFSNTQYGTFATGGIQSISATTTAITTTTDASQPPEVSSVASSSTASAVRITTSETSGGDATSEESASKGASQTTPVQSASPTSNAAPAASVGLLVVYLAAAVVAGGLVL